MQIGGKRAIGVRDRRAEVQIGGKRRQSEFEYKKNREYKILLLTLVSEWIDCSSDGGRRIWKAGGLIAPPHPPIFSFRLRRAGFRIPSRERRISRGGEDSDFELRERNRISGEAQPKTKKEIGDETDTTQERRSNGHD